MIVSNLHKQMAALDSKLHRNMKVKQQGVDWSIAAELNALFVAGAEFGDVCREYPILFVRAGNDDKGKALVAPIAALGLAQRENLYLAGKQWRALYIPAVLRAYPFGTGRVGPEQRTVLSIDLGWAGLSQTEGVPLFDDEGKPSEHLQALNKQLEQLELEVQRTRELCRFLLDKDLLRDMRFDAELPDGQKLKVDGFLTIDEKRVAALPDADVLQMHRSGVMGLIYAHYVSMGNMRKLVQWRVDSLPPSPAADQTAAAAPS
jgi:hypothetical protein